MKKIFLLLLLFAIDIFAQQTSVAVLPSEGTILGNDELEVLTDKMRESALKVLPTNAFVLLKQDVVVRRLGGAEKYIKECRESSCIVDLGKKAQVDYVAQASVGKLGNRIRLKVELYNVRTEGLVGMLSDEESENIIGLLSIVEKRVPTEVFGKIPGASVGSKASPLVAGGISGLEKTTDYELGGGKRYLVNLSTEPSGALLSFNGMPASGCPKTPCKIELSGGNVRIIAALEQHETVDTTVSIAHNNQSIAIRLKSNFGILEIRPAYIDGIGDTDDWNLSINDRAYSSFENRFSPGNYNVKLSHRCYEPVNFMAGINKGSREVFDMSKHIKLKKGGLALSAEKNGEPASEPVFVNGKQVGETPFIDAVPLCSEIEIGENRETVSVILKHNENVNYKHKLDLYAPIQGPMDSHAKKDTGKSTSFWVALSLDIVGAAIIYAGLLKNKDITEARYNYDMPEQSRYYYDNAWEGVESKRSNRNMLYAVGGIFLASGIGVHIWF
jgi:TolB-like protein